MRFLVAGWSLGVLAAGSACAQYVISSHSGVIQYVEGRAYLATKRLSRNSDSSRTSKRTRSFAPKTVARKSF